MDEALNSLDKRKLTEDEADHCDGVLKIDSFGRMVKLLKDGKSPGMDGLSGEFYQTFWMELRDQIVCCYKYSVETGKLSETQKKEVITLILKGGNPTVLRSYRPITLLNTGWVPKTST